MMDKRSANKFNMYKVVHNWINGNMESLNTLPGFSETNTQFGGLIGTIGDLDKSKTIVTTGFTISKGESRTHLETLVIETTRIIKVFATFNNDQVLLNDVDFTESQLSRSSEQLLLVRAQKCIDHAEAILPTAQAYGLNAERIEALKQAYSSFDHKQTTVRSAIVNRKDAGEQLEAHMDEADDLLKSKIDLLMELSQNTQPELYNQYKASREIIDRA